MPFLIFAVLFRSAAKNFIIVVGLLIAISAWYTVSHLSAGYDRWVECGRPQTTVCPLTSTGNPV